MEVELLLQKYKICSMTGKGKIKYRYMDLLEISKCQNVRPDPDI